MVAVCIRVYLFRVYKLYMRACVFVRIRVYSCVFLACVFVCIRVYVSICQSTHLLISARRLGSLFIDRHALFENVVRFMYHQQRFNATCVAH